MGEFIYMVCLQHIVVTVISCYGWVLRCGLFTAYKLWKYADPIGAIVICIYILVSWFIMGCGEFVLLIVSFNNFSMHFFHSIFLVVFYYSSFSV